MSRVKQIDRIESLEAGMSSVLALLQQIVSKPQESPTVSLIAPDVTPNVSAATKVQAGGKKWETAEFLALPVSSRQWTAVRFAFYAAKGSLSQNDATKLGGIFSATNERAIYKLGIVRSAAKALTDATFGSVAMKDRSVEAKQAYCSLLAATYNAGLKARK